VGVKLSYFFSGILVFAGLIRKNSKSIAMFMLILLWVLYGWNTDNADYMNYNAGYYYNADSPINYSYQIGFQLLSKLLYKLGLEYSGFLIVISMMGLILITSTIRRYTKNVAFVLAMYFIFPFMLDVVQVKNFLAMAIVVFALRFLIEKRRMGRFKYIFFIVLASTFHYVALFYLVFLLKEIWNVKKLTYYSITIATVGVAISYTDLIPRLVAKITSNVRVYVWFTNKMNLGIIVVLLIHVSTLFLVHYAYKRIKNAEIKYSQESIVNSKKRYLNKSFVKPNRAAPKFFNINMNFVNFTYKINIISLLAFPLYVFNMSFFRVYRNIFIINYMLFSIFLFNIKYDKNEKLLCNFLLFFYVIIMAAYYIIIPHYDSVFLAVLQNNSLLGK